MAEINFQVVFSLPCAEYPKGRIICNRNHGGRVIDLTDDDYSAEVVEGLVDELLAVSEGYKSAADCFNGKDPLIETPLTEAA